MQKFCYHCLTSGQLALSQVCLLQNGNLKHKVQGADTPLLSSQVLQLTPITADTDDLTVSGVLNLSQLTPWIKNSTTGGLKTDADFGLACRRMAY